MVNLNITCGCGKLKAHNLQEAIQHANTTGHTVGISGEVKPEKLKKTTVSISQIRYVGK